MTSFAAPTTFRVLTQQFNYNCLSSRCRIPKCKTTEHRHPFVNRETTSDDFALVVKLAKSPVSQCDY